MRVFAALVSTIICSTFVAAKGDHKQIARHLEKRFGGHATYFIDGLGACGQYSGPNDFIVALNTPQYGSGSPGPQCFKQIEISAGGKSTVATIMDECPTCPFGCLDFSQGLFQYFNDLSVGEFPISWSFVGGGGGGGNKPPATTHHKAPPPPPPPTTTHTHHTTPTTTSSTQQSTTHLHTTPTTTKTHHTTTSTSTSTSASSTTSSSPATVDNFEQISEFILSLENLLNAARGN